MHNRPITILLTCEHGGNQVPADYRKLFTPHRELLQSHRGWDPGTKQLGERWQKTLGCELHIATVTRLLVDLNRSPHHPQVFSEITRELPSSERDDLLKVYHTPHRQRVYDSIASAIRSKQRVLHVGLHSFTPELNGEVRNADIGLLYDPSRAWELELSRRWRQALRSTALQPRVRLNYPYRGATDGLTTFLRTQFTSDSYAGIELEVNQQFPLVGGKAWTKMQAACMSTLEHLLAG